MSQGRQTSADTSYGRSAGQAAGRGLLLLVGALIVGLLLLRGVNDRPNSVKAARSPAPDTVAVDDTSAVTPVDGSTAATPTTAPAAGVTRRAPSLVGVLVVNGSGKNRAASKVAISLKSAQYGVRKSLDANSSTLSGTVYFNADFQTEASDIAQILGIPGMIQPMPVPEPLKVGASPEPHDILVVVDAAMAARFAGDAASTGAAPTATAGPSA